MVVFKKHVGNGVARFVLLTTDMNGIEKRTVYVIRSEVDPSRHYTGITNDVPTRLKWHNTGRCGHTSADRPWSLVVTLQFPTERNAVRFEKYLKTGSGRAFAKRHLAGISMGGMNEPQ